MPTPRIIHIFLAALLAFLIATTWTYLTRHMYDYNVPFSTVLGVSVFPVIAWTIALTVGYLCIRQLLAILRRGRFATQFIIVAGVCAIVVIIVETVGYHWVGIRNIGTSQYAGIPICDCLHAPLWMQFGYFALGPLHWLLAEKVFTPSNLWYFFVRSDKIV